jgi:Xaa-Pro aminopeptidase
MKFETISKLAMDSTLSKLRELMKEKGIDVYVLPRTDEHQSEYLCACDERLAFISSFTGSNGLALISQKEALMWTDGRYFLQAEKELGEGWEMRKMGRGEQRWFEHIAKEYPKGTVVEIDGQLMSAQTAAERRKVLQEAEMELRFGEGNLVNTVWVARPPPSMAPIFVHELWSGKPITEKVGWVRERIQQKAAEAAVFADVGEIAWLLNVRSSEFPCNPMFKGVLVVTGSAGTLYLPAGHPSQDNEELRAHLLTAQIELKPYDP